jgi:uncharacterized protein
MTEATVIVVRVTARAGRDEIVSLQAGELRLRLRAPAVEGQANEALHRFLANRLKLRLNDVEIVSGEKSRVKRLRLLGLSQDELERRLAGSSAESA